VNAEWVLAKIDMFLELVERYHVTSDQKVNDEIKAMLPVMERIAARVTQ
jgi:hypothetical protein